MTATVLHLAPHADDELIGAPATLLALRDAGWRVVNLVCSLGAPDQRVRRLAELEEACARAGFDLVVAPAPVGDPLEEAGLDDVQHVLETAIADVTAQVGPVLVVAPSPHDRHRGHEVVGRAAVSVLSRRGDDAPRLWLWGLWADLPLPTLAVGFDEKRLEEIFSALEAHAGELARNDYRRVVRGRAEMNASLGPERVFGFGSAGADVPYVEILTEVARAAGSWVLGRARWLDAGEPLPPPGGRDVGEWLTSPSITTRYGPPPSG
ncbi:MAG: PIG-L deacetylase family protein [Acidimicrobiales bacterium]